MDIRRLLFGARPGPYNALRQETHVRDWINHGIQNLGCNDTTISFNRILAFACRVRTGNEYSFKLNQRYYDREANN